MFEEIQKTIEVLQSGGLILYPTDTIWGIGCDATNEEAVKKIYALKKREESKSLITLVSEPSMLNIYVEEVPAVAWDLIEFAEHPLTIVYPGAKKLAPNIIAPDGSAAIRVVSDEFCKKLIYKFRKPIVSTSCNISGEPAPSIFREISSAILDGVDYIVNLRQNDFKASKPSTIIKFEANGVFKFIRK